VPFSIRDVLPSVSARARTFDPVDPTLITAIASLLAAIVGAGAVLGAQRLDWRRQQAAGQRAALTESVIDVIVVAGSIANRGRDLAGRAKAFTSLGGQANRLIGIVVPLDEASLFEPLRADLERLDRAAARVLVEWDEEGIAKVNAVLDASAAVFAAAVARPSKGEVLRPAKELFSGKSFGDREQLGSAAQRLADERAKLIDYARRRSNLPALESVVRT
jgi:hypothetical protein